MSLRRILVILGLAAMLAAGAATGAGATPPDLGGAVSIGDSYSSGEGAGPVYDAGTNVAQNRCHRSPLAWPRLLGVPAAGHLACSGATIVNLTSGQTPLAPDNSGQLARLAGTPLAPSAVFVTLGGNDAGFADILRRCVIGSCISLVEADTTRLPALGVRLEAGYREISAAARGGRVLVVGYPDLIPSRPPRGLRCLWLGDREVPATLGFIAKLNATIADAARRAGVEFVATGDAFDGHELCTASSWVFPIIFSANPQQAHPRPPGQAAMAARVRAYLLANPTPPGVPVP